MSLARRLVCGAALALHAGAATPVRAAPALGARFALDAPALGSAPAGGQSAGHVASGPNGSVAVWVDQADSITWTGDGWLKLAGAFLPRGSTAPVPLGRSFDVRSAEDDIAVAWAGRGFMVLYAASNGIFAARLDPAGAWLDATPRQISGAFTCDPDLACNDSGQCVAIVTGCWNSGPLSAIGFGWNTSTVNEQTLVPGGSPNSPGGQVARSGSNFVVAYTVGSALADGGYDRQFFTQALSPAGDLLGSARLLPTGTEFGAYGSGIHTNPALASLGDGAAVFFTTFDGILHLLALDSLGAPTGTERALGPGPSGIATVSQLGSTVVASEGNTAVVFRSDGGSTVAQRVDGTGPLADLGIVSQAPVGAAAFDGSGFWLLDTDTSASVLRSDTRRAVGRYLPSPLGTQDPAASFSPLSIAPNSQWGLRVLASPDGAGGLAVWNDNRSDESDVYGVPLDADGCPSGPSAPIIQAPGRQELIAALVDDGGYLIAATNEGAQTESRTYLGRVGFDGALVEPRCVDLEAAWKSAQPVDYVPDGCTSDPYGGGCGVWPVGAVRTDAGLVSVVLDGLDGNYVDWGFLASDVRLHYTDSSGQVTRADVVSPLHVPVSVDTSVYPAFIPRASFVVRTAVGHIVVIALEESTNGASSWQAGVVSTAGEWSGLFDVPAPSDTNSLADVKRLGSDYYFLLGRGRTFTTSTALEDGGVVWTPGDPGRFWLLRTSSTFQAIELDDLGVAMPATDEYDRGALGPGTALPSLFSPSLEPPPRQVRVTGHRLDGLACAPVAPSPPSDAGARGCTAGEGADAGARPDAGEAGAGKDAGDMANALDASADSAALHARGGGCGCRLSGDHGSRGERLAWMAVSVVLGARKRRRGRRLRS